MQEGKRVFFGRGGAVDSQEILSPGLDWTGPPPPLRLPESFPCIMSRAPLAAIWSEAALPAASLHAIKFTGKPVLPSSYRVDDLAQACIGATALAASQVLAHRTGEDMVYVSVAAEDAAAEFRCEQLGTLDGEVSRIWSATELSLMPSVRRQARSGMRWQDSTRLPMGGYGLTRIGDTIER